MFLFQKMIQECECPDDDGPERIEQDHPRRDVLQFPDDRIMFRLDFIEQILNQRVHDFRSEDEEDRKYNQRRLHCREAKQDCEEQRYACSDDVDFEIALLAQDRA